MKKFLLSVCIFLLSVSFVWAKEFDYRDIASYPVWSADRPLTFGGFLTVYFNSVALYEGIPDSYQYIGLNFQNIRKDTPLYRALQKGVYMGFLKNLPINLNTKELATDGQFARAMESNLGKKIDRTGTGILTLHTILDTLSAIYYPTNSGRTEGADDANITLTLGNLYPITTVSNFPILNDVYQKLKYDHYDSAKFKDEDLIQGAAKGMAEASKDKHTAYFPPVESKNFQDGLSGEFEGIGAYVDMPKPGELHIISPIPGTPAEKAGLKGGDTILKIDDLIITEETTLEEAVNKIKGAEGTTVKIRIRRGTAELDFNVIRAKITINYVEYKKLDNNDYLVKISLFGAGVKDAFVQALGTIAKDNGNGKIIIDLRNNPGGSLDEVANMLGYFVPKDQSVVHIKYKNTTSEMLSEGTKIIDFSGKRIVILINGGSASASEIMAGTIKDYLSNTTKIIGEKSYGKGSVQSLDSYMDGSSFKYTIAKWFTGKTQTGIDGTGIKPDIEVKFDEEQWKSNKDNQLDYAKGLSW